MSDGNLNISFTTEEKDLVKAQAKVIKQQEEMIEKYKKMGAESKKSSKDAEKYAASAAKELERFANATKLINRTPLERYADTMHQLNRALKAGKLDQESFNRAAARAKTEYDGVAKAGNLAFGASALDNLTSYAAGLLSISAGLGTVAGAFREVQQRAEEIGGRQRADMPSMSQLSQVATSDAHYLEMVEASQQTFVEGGTDTIGGAAVMQFGLTSADLEKFRKDVNELAASGAMDNLPAVVDSAAGLRDAFGEKEAGGFRFIVSKAIGASQLGRGNVTAQLQAASEAGAQAGALGLSDEDTFAGVATISPVTGASVAGTQLRSLFTAIEKDGITGGYLERGRSLKEYLGDIKSLETSGEDIRTVLGGRQEAIDAYRTLAKNIDKYDINMANTIEAGKNDRFGEVINRTYLLPQNSGVRMLKEAQARSEMAWQEQGTMSNAAQAVARDLETKAYQQEGGFGWAMTAMWNKVDRFLGGDKQFVEDFKSEAHPRTQQYIDRMNAAAEALERSAQHLEGASDPSRTNAARANQAAAGGAVEAR